MRVLGSSRRANYHRVAITIENNILEYLEYQSSPLAQYRAKNFALVIKSHLFEEIFVDAKGVNCASLEIVREKKIFDSIFFNR